MQPANLFYRDVFFEFYTDVAMTVPNDNDFVNYVSKQWSINENDHIFCHKQRTRELVGIIRNRALSKANR